MKKREYRAWDGVKMLYDIIPLGPDSEYAITDVQGLPNSPAALLYVKVKDVMDFTGILDIKGKKIFEGDIFRCTEELENGICAVH